MLLRDGIDDDSAGTVVTSLTESDQYVVRCDDDLVVSAAARFVMRRSEAGGADASKEVAEGGVAAGVSLLSATYNANARPSVGHVSLAICRLEARDEL